MLGFATQEMTYFMVTSLLDRLLRGEAECRGTDTVHQRTPGGRGAKTSRTRPYAGFRPVAEVRVGLPMPWHDTGRAAARPDTAPARCGSRSWPLARRDACQPARLRVGTGVRG